MSYKGAFKKKTGEGVNYQCQFPKDFVRPYGAATHMDLTDNEACIFRIKPVNCEWTVRPEFALSEIADTLFKTVQPSADLKTLVNPRLKARFNRIKDALCDALMPFWHRKDNPAFQATMTREEVTHAMETAREYVVKDGEDDNESDAAFLEEYTQTMLVVGAGLTQLGAQIRVMSACMSDLQGLNSKTVLNSRTKAFKAKPTFANLCNSVYLGKKKRGKPTNEQVDEEVGGRLMRFAVDGDDEDGERPRRRQPVRSRRRDISEDSSDGSQSSVAPREKKARKKNARGNATCSVESDDSAQPRHKTKSRKGKRQKERPSPSDDSEDEAPRQKKAKKRTSRTSQEPSSGSDSRESSPPKQADKRANVSAGVRKGYLEKGGKASTRSNRQTQVEDCMEGTSTSFSAGKRTAAKTNRSRALPSENADQRDGVVHEAGAGKQAMSLVGMPPEPAKVAQTAAAKKKQKKNKRKKKKAADRAAKGTVRVERADPEGANASTVPPET